MTTITVTAMRTRTIARPATIIATETSPGKSEDEDENHEGHNDDVDEDSDDDGSSTSSSLAEAHNEPARDVACKVSFNCKNMGYPSIWKYSRTHKTFNFKTDTISANV